MYASGYKKGFGQGYSAPSNFSRYANDFKYSNKPIKKRSGAKFKFSKHGKPLTIAWKATRYGMLSILCGLTKYSNEVTSKSGRVWYSGVSVAIKNTNTGQTNFHFGLMEKATGKVIVKNLGWVINPNGGYGGVVAKIGGRPRR